MEKIFILPAQQHDLDEVNTIISSCVMGWDLPERVKRLSIASYQYEAQDLDYLQIFIATNADNKIVGVAALDEACPSGLPEKKSGILLHGLYIKPDAQQQGIGLQFIQFIMKQVHQRQLDGLLVKAQANASSYFKKQGFEKLPVIDPAKDYPHRWWMPDSAI